MSQDPEKSSLPRPTRLPRSSKLPVPCSVLDPPPIPRIPTRYQAGSLRSKTQIRNDSQQESSLKEEAQGDIGEGDERWVGPLPLPKAASTDDPSDFAKVGQPTRGKNEQQSQDSPVKHSRPRPSLSDRTIETLSQVPPTPSPRRRRSSFFPAESSDRTPQRTGLSPYRPRPSTSHGHYINTPSMAPRSTSPAKRLLLPTPSADTTPIKSTPSRRAASLYPSQGSQGRVKQRDGIVPMEPLEPNSSRQPKKSAFGSNIYTSTSTKSRAPMTGLFKKPTIPSQSIKEGKASARRDISDKSTDSSDSHLCSSTSRQSSLTSQASIESKAASVKEVSTASRGSSSAVLRESIAKAKAAHRKAAISRNRGTPKHPADDTDIFSVADNEGLLRKRIGVARTDGRLNIAALGLTEIPGEVLHMYDLDAVDASGGAWYESVDITRLIAADNQIEVLSDSLFPNESMDGLRNADDESKGTIFGGLETIDLHGNRLVKLPHGLRHLEFLTNLNLSKNKLTNKCLDPVIAIKSLHELRLADNKLTNIRSLCQLKSLQVLDIHNNAIGVLPDELQDLIHLRILNAAGNQIQTAQPQRLGGMPLVEVDLSRNRLSGTLLPHKGDGFRHLKMLDISSNALSLFAEDETLILPELRSLNVSQNRLQTLPNLSRWTSLTTLSAANNALVAFPDGMASLRSLRNVDLSSNNIKKLVDDLANMENLTMLNIANNPLRERRFLTMNTEDLKRDIRNRLELKDTSEAQQDGNPLLSVSAVDNQEQPHHWPIKPGGVLDRSSTTLVTVDFADIEPLVPASVKSVLLHHNHISAIPTSVALLSSSLTNLDLSHNTLTGSTYLPRRLELLNLRSISLVSNTVTSLDPLTANLLAPRLEELIISYNRVNALPSLREHFPSLTRVDASDNQISALSVESVRGLQICNVARNDIGHLEPELGLLEGAGLRILVVEGNRFRVPRREVVEGGTEKLLRWLRGKIPES